MHSCSPRWFCSELSGRILARLLRAAATRRRLPSGLRRTRSSTPPKVRTRRWRTVLSAFTLLVCSWRRFTPVTFLWSQTAGAPATCGAARNRTRTGAPGRASSAAASAAACRRARPATRRPAASATRTGPRTATGPTSARERRRTAGGWGMAGRCGVFGVPRPRAARERLPPAHCWQSGTVFCTV
jgi:hypothetical protein